MLYSVVLVSAVQQSESAMCIHKFPLLFLFPSHLGRHRALRKVACAVQQVLSGLVAKLRPTLETPWTVVHQAPLSMGFPRHECWSGVPFPSPGDLLDPEVKPGLPHCRQILYRLIYTREAVINHTLKQLLETLVSS